MIAARNIFARDAQTQLIGASVEVKQGVHAIIGHIADGTALFLSILAGAVRPSRGEVLVDRRTVAFVPLDAALPEFLHVSEVLAMAAEARGEPMRAPESILDVLGVSSLAPLRVRSLSPGERRAVLLAEALASSVATNIIVHEPSFLLDARASVLFSRALVTRPGCAIIGTTSTREAAAVASSYTLLSRGRVAHVGATLDGLSLEGSGGARFRVTVDQPGVLLSALAADASLRVETRSGSVIVLGTSAEATARAINDAIANSSVNVTEISPEPLALEELRATAQGKAAAAFHAAMSRAAPPPQMPPPPAPPPPPPALPPPEGPLQ